MSFEIWYKKRVNVSAAITARRGANFATPRAAKVALASPLQRGLEEVREALGEMWLPRLYRERILKLRTRSHALPVQAKANRVEIQHTLLGVELKTGRRRILCPDLATARYLAVFARAGCTEVAVPYDITKISLLADELESSWHRMLLLVERAAAERSPAFRTRVRSALIADIRREIAEAGAGTVIPQFNQNTKQRRA
ncbi:MAG: hypothetical protein JO360_17805 [Acidobacteria bacterium]|nr:hypothetical protein [Acidobacteriota bacterium]